MSNSRKQRTPMRAIRAKCLDCTNGQVAEVRRCPCIGCPLFVYRFGHRPTEGVSEAIKVEDDKSVGNDMLPRKTVRRRGLESK